MKLLQGKRTLLKFQEIDRIIKWIINLLSKHSALVVIVFWLLAANLSHIILRDPIGWLITLAFFMFIPGYLLLQIFSKSLLDKWQTLSFCLGLSIVLLMLDGLILNTLFVLGVHRPLTALNIYIALDLMTVLLLAFNLKRLGRVTIPKMRKLKAIEIKISLAVLIMPVLAIFGAIQLNNGGSNILTLLLFILIPLVLFWLIVRSQLEKFSPIVLFSIALAILFSTSLRGWNITGHDIQQEFVVFQLTAQNAHWSIAAFRNAYNACLSLTILPTIILKLTTIPAAYVFKVVFQIVFAFTVIPIYLFMKLVSNKKIAILGAFVFISFPAFLNDMPFLNRQEIGILFFTLILLAAFIKQQKMTKERKILIVFFLFGMVLSHYSTMYITLMLLLIAGLINWILKIIYKKNQEHTHPVIGPRLLLIAFLLTLCWNLQLTNTAKGLNTAISSTLHSFIDQSGEQANSVSYSLLGQHTQSPQALLNSYAGANRNGVQYIGQPNLPITKLGQVMGHIFSPISFNTITRSISAKILQILLLLGILIILFRNRKKFSQYDTYYLSLCLSAVVLLIIETLLPELSIDFGTERLFQQLLVVLGVPMVIGTLFIIPKDSKKIIFATVFLGILFLDLSGFIPEIIGGYPAQMALNNSGVYYEAYYVHQSELESAKWLLTNKRSGIPIEMDQYSEYRFMKPILLNKLNVVPVTGVNKYDYFYQDTGNVVTNTYQASVGGDRIRYILTGNVDAQKNLIYNDGTSKIYK